MTVIYDAGVGENLIILSRPPTPRVVNFFQFSIQPEDWIDDSKRAKVGLALPSMIRYAFSSSKISDNNDDPFFDALLSPTKQRLKMLWISAAWREPFTELSSAFLTWGNMNYGDGDGDIDYSLSLLQRSSRNAFSVSPGNVSISTVIVVGTENKLKVICLTWLAGSKFSIGLRGRVGVSMSMTVLLKFCFWVSLRTR